MGTMVWVKINEGFVSVVLLASKNSLSDEVINTLIRQVNRKNKTNNVDLVITKTNPIGIVISIEANRKSNIVLKKPIFSTPVNVRQKCRQNVTNKAINRCQSDEFLE